MLGSVQSSILALLLSAALAVGTAGRAQEVDASAATASPMISTAPGTPSTDLWSRIFDLQGGATVFLAACCKTCRKGKACGDSCISRSYTCRKGVGCACDG